MVDALNEAAAAAAATVAGKAFFADDLVLGELQSQGLLFQDFFDPSVDELPGIPVESGGGGDEEEELEWLADKDAFPSLETSFEIPAHSLSGGSSSGWSGSNGGAAVREGPSPVSVLASAASFSAPARPRSKGRTRRRRPLTAISPQPAATAPARKARATERRWCRHCLAEETPQWRAGPEGLKTLCNACGVRYKSGRLVPEYRPASSPTFSATIHSNSHRRILEMRRQKEPSHERKITRLPPPPPPQMPLAPPFKSMKKIKK
ncbi:GATA transcription factor 1-like [Zingiber officinale]|uniref:GATA transcription factor 1-like n=1 Tax=Zingiber officinale TaxID=94328 RepID=UPI001C4BC74A|nr:GATA transcription factor 1-like [Zingiber officinale]